MSGNSKAFENSEISWPRPLRFWLLLIFDIPAIIASLFLLYHLLFDRTQRRALHNHTIIVLILLAFIFQLLDISWYLDFLRQGIVWPQTPAHCLTWWLVDLGFYNTVAIILAWASIERHILIFHDRWIATTNKCFFVHYLPLILLLLYATIYYTILIFFPPCENTYMYTLPVCAATPCHLFDPILGMWEFGVHGCLCTIIIVVSNISLIIRVIIQKRRRTRGFQFRKYRKMIFQLLAISILYLLFNLPIMIMWMARLCGLPASIGVEEQLIGFFLTYWVMLLLPIVSFIALPGLKQKMKKILHILKRHRPIVAPNINRIIDVTGGQQQYEMHTMK